MGVVECNAVDYFASQVVFVLVGGMIPLLIL
jgi:hypothetical protein